MTIYNLYIYNRKGECIYYREWNRAKQSGLVQEQVIISDKNYLKNYLDKLFEFKKKKEFRQMFGCIVEMKSFVNKISPNDLMYFN
jgi:hypothetical protein